MKEDRKVRNHIPRLRDIFAATDIITYGPFSLMQSPDGDFKHAKFTAEGHEIALTPMQKKVMAVLISSHGHIVTPAALHKGLEKRGRAAPNYMQAYVSQIRKAIEAELSGKIDPQMVEDLKDCFCAINPVRSRGQTGDVVKRKFKGSYVLMDLDIL